MSKPESLCLALRQFEKRCDLGVVELIEIPQRMTKLVQA